ncbi:hypothetical protein J6W32_04790 [bacterium]|nr:hypothetical protein [bacterium]
MQLNNATNPQIGMLHFGSLSAQEAHNFQVLKVTPFVAICIKYGYLLKSLHKYPSLIP